MTVVENHTLIYRVMKWFTRMVLTLLHSVTPAGDELVCVQGEGDIDECSHRFSKHFLSGMDKIRLN